MSWIIPAWRLFGQELPVSRFILLRLFLVLSGTLLAVAVLERRYSVLTRFRNEKSTALNLAIARIAVAATLLWQIHLHEILLATSLDPVLRVPFRIWGSLASRLIAPPAITTSVYAIFLVSTLCMLLGLFGRFAAAVTATSAVYLISPLFLYGKVDHLYHHLIFFSVICAVFPSTDALSADVWIRSRTSGALYKMGRQAGLSYGFAMRSLWLYVALSYYFPGLWKFSRGWLTWLSGNALEDHIAFGGYGVSWNPLELWFLQHRLAMSVSSSLVVCFELGFVFLILFPRLRPLAGLAGLAFHAAVYLVLGITFVALATCYVIFFDWTAIFRLQTAPATGITSPANASWSARAVSLAGLGLMALLGLFHVTDTWPISCFPTFDAPNSPIKAELSIQELDAGEPRDWPLTADPRLRAVYRRWYWLARQGIVSRSATRPKVAALVQLWLQAHPEIHVHQIAVSVDRYRLLPLEQSRVRLSRHPKWRFAF
ncbi:MAG TPA: HTTM domain-containing protein [Bryobacteraceae bacterium]|nr:HTTM domain-containing protein [Bryobacteraceae bacterium]